jgi:hypothetical protein
MSRYGTKILLACLLMGFGVFYGLDMAKQGTEYVNGPLQQQEPSQVTLPVQEILPEEKEEPIVEEELKLELRPVTADKAIHRLSNKIGSLIQATLQGGVEIIVSIFEGVIH